MQNVAVSIVSHGHGEMVNAVVNQLLLLPEVGQVILTRNIPEQTSFVRDPRVQVIENTIPMGFGANHNAAFKLCRLPFYCVLNPDIVLQHNPFPTLIGCLSDDRTKLSAPCVTAPDGILEDSARYFPDLRSLLRKALGGDDGRYQIGSNLQPFPVDWVAGMFMLFKADTFRAVGGFDEKFFLYYEDVDICARLWRTGASVSVCPSVRVIHDARRASRTNSRYMRWHAASMLRYFVKHWWRLPRKHAN